MLLHLDVGASRRRCVGPRRLRGGYLLWLQRSFRTWRRRGPHRLLLLSLSRRWRGGHLSKGHLHHRPRGLISNRPGGVRHHRPFGLFFEGRHRPLSNRRSAAPHVRRLAEPAALRMNQIPVEQDSKTLERETRISIIEKQNEEPALTQMAWRGCQPTPCWPSGAAQTRLWRWAPQGPPQPSS